MNDWDYHKNEFIKLGGVVENLICRLGCNGRGMFREGKNHYPKILCPPQLLIDVKDIYLIGNNFHLKEETGHSPEEKKFIENYYQYFSWGEAGKQEITKFMKEITEIPTEAKRILVSNKICSSELLNSNPSLQLSFHKFISSRRVKYQNKAVLAPIWELVNHSPFASSLKTSQAGVETPLYPIEQTTNEIHHAYKRKGSPMSIFFNYGFSSNEVFAYALPSEIKISDTDLTIRIEGMHSGIESKDKKIIFRDKTLTIPALPLGSIAKKLPTAFFYSIVQEYGISEDKASSLIRQLQESNTDQRKRLRDLMSTNPNNTAKALIKSINRELHLIEIASRAI